MKTAVIHLDGQAYCGVDSDHSYTRKTPGNLCCYGSPERDMLLIGTGDPHEICGVRSLRTVLENILERIGDDLIAPHQITITFQ